MNEKETIISVYVLDIFLDNGKQISRTVTSEEKEKFFEQAVYNEIDMISLPGLIVFKSKISLIRAQVIP